VKQPLDHLRSRKKPVSRRVAIATDSELADALNSAKLRVAQLHEQLKTDPKVSRDVPDAEDEVARLEDEIEPHLAWFVARNMGVGAYEDLQSAHPPTPDQVKENRKKGLDLSWNPDTFPPALLAACVLYEMPTEDGGEPTLEPLSEDFVKEMWDSPEWNQAEVMALFQAAIEVHSLRRIVEMGNASRRVRN
jgi:hypothetical protein